MSKPSKINIVGIIQARMGSTRLPGKILSGIVGKPMLWHVVNRLKSCKFLDKIVVATSISRKDDCVEDFCKKFYIECFRGKEEDVLDRYYKAAKFYKASAVVRITADCPLIDPCIVDKTIKCYLKNLSDFDGASNVISRTYPRGLDAEVYSFAALEKTHKQAKLPYQREHVTIYIHEHPELFRVVSLRNREDLSELRWTVDERADLDFVREIYKMLYPPMDLFCMKDVLKVLKVKPEFKEINRHIIQKIAV